MWTGVEYILIECQLHINRIRLCGWMHSASLLSTNSHMFGHHITLHKHGEKNMIQRIWGSRVKLYISALSWKLTAMIMLIRKKSGGGIKHAINKPLKGNEIISKQ